MEWAISPGQATRLTPVPGSEVYDVEEQPVPTVRVRAVGVKEGNRVRIGRRMIDL
jgi:hypothetical protein